METTFNLACQLSRVKLKGKHLLWLRELMRVESMLLTGKMCITMEKIFQKNIVKAQHVKLGLTLGLLATGLCLDSQQIVLLTPRGIRDLSRHLNVKQFDMTERFRHMLPLKSLTDKCLRESRHSGFPVLDD